MINLVKRIWKVFWVWYERNYFLTLGITTGIFVLQVIHLYWLGADVLSERIIRRSFFNLSGFWQYVIVALDYTEIPSLVGISLVYVYELRKKLTARNILFLLLVNTQWLHLFWITDEFVVSSLGGNIVDLPLWLALVAILIDYLEVPVMIDASVKFIRKAKKRAFLTQNFN